MSGLRFRAFGFAFGRGSLSRCCVTRVQRRARATEHRPKKFVEAIAAAKGAGHSDPSPDHRENRENHQWHQHDLRTFVDAAVAVSTMRIMPVPGFRVAAISSKE